MRILIVGFCCFLILACAPKKIKKTALPDNSKLTSGDTRTVTVESLDEDTYWLTDAATDSGYDLTKENPVKVGNRGGSGPMNERRFLNALLGPSGEAIGYFRSGSCCHFETPNGLMGGRGLLDIYGVFLQGGKDTVNIYINMYDEGDLFIPKGFTAKSNNSSIKN